MKKHLGLGALVALLTAFSGEAYAALPYVGVALSSAEWAVNSDGTGELPGTYGTHYTYPDPAEHSGWEGPSYYLGKGMTTFRVPFRWERVQPNRNQAFDATEFGRLTSTVNNLTAMGAYVILDPHNYARYGTEFIGAGGVPNSDFADFWSRLSDSFKDNPRVIFGLMNEPYGLPTEQWVSAANAAIQAIRNTGATNLILVPGNGWDGAHSWHQDWYGTPNATAMLNIVDPGDNYAFEVHQYLDADSGGWDRENCVSATIGSERMQGFTTWLRQNGFRGFLGEFGGGVSATCQAAIDDQLDHMEQNDDVYIGWTWWAGGPWWCGDVEPSCGPGDTVQMDVLEQHLGGSTPTCSDGVQNGAETGVDCGGTCPPCGTGGTGGGGTGGTGGGGTGGSTGGGGGTGGAGGCTVATYEAENMYQSTGGDTPDGWNIWSDGYVSTDHDFVAGTTTITVVASGDYAGGEWPHMNVLVGGAIIGDIPVESDSWQSYEFSFDATAGTHEVRVEFDNDFNDGAGDDRNLLVDKVTVGCPSTTAESCTDGVRNQDESDTDCGGTSCAACPLGASCSVAGDCQTGACTGGVCDCGAGLTVCSGACVDTQSSGAHCGACNSACQAGQVCSAGVCSDSCASGLAQCGQDCVDLASSLAHCGACDTPCALAGAVSACMGGVCTVASCQPGFVDLDADPANGCEYACTVQGAEACNGLDDDCNGAIDDGLVCGGTGGTGGIGGTGGVAAAGATPGIGGVGATTGGTGPAVGGSGAAVPTGTGGTGALPAAGDPSADEGGCGCSTPGSGRRVSGIAGLLLGAALLFGRRRR